METKICCQCKFRLPITDFYSNKSKKDGLQSRCKKCKYIYDKADNCKHPERRKIRAVRARKKYWENPEKFRMDSKEWGKNNPEKKKDIFKNCYKKNKEKYMLVHKKWVKNNPEKIKAIAKKARAEKRSTLSGRLDIRISTKIRRSLNGNKNRQHWESLVGYSVFDLKKHIESLFTCGMNWELYLSGKIHLDHITPLSFFEYFSADDQEFKYAWSLDNLQPLWARDNIIKGDTLPTWQSVTAQKKLVLENLSKNVA